MAKIAREVARRKRMVSSVMHLIDWPDGPKKAFVYSLLPAILLLFVLPAQLKPSSFMQDDSYFYVQVASNILRGDGSTFHNITPTNGYHPLWMLFSVLGLLTAGNDKLLGLNVVFGLQALLFLATAYYLRRVAGVIADDGWLVGVVILAIYYFSTGVYASEAHLNGLMIVMTIYFLVLALEYDNSSDWVKAGVFSGLAVLARLDNVFVIGALFSLMPLNEQEWGVGRTLKRVLLAGAVSACIVAPYLLHNFIFYGHLVPISGAIKSTFPVVTGNIQNLGRFGQGTALFGLLSVLLSFDPTSKMHQKALLRGLGTGVLLHAVYVVLYTSHYTFWPWYYVSGVVNMAFLSGVILQRINWSVHRLTRHRFVAPTRYLIVTVLVLIGIGRGWLKASNPDSIGPLPIPKINECRWPNDVAVWMREHLPPGSAVFMYDYPGAIAYYSDLQILPMDGLMNDFEYNDDLLNQGINQYLCTNNVRFFFGPDDGSKGSLQEFEVLAPLHTQPVGTLSLLDQHLVVRVRDVVSCPEETPPLGIWRIDPCDDVE